jgi:hypothetical protein
MGWVVNARPRPLYPRERDPVPIVQEACWAPGLAWTGAENLAYTGIRSPDRPARSDPRYRLSYPGPWRFSLSNYRSTLVASKHKHGFHFVYILPPPFLLAAMFTPMIYHILPHAVFILYKTILKPIWTYSTP